MKHSKDIEFAADDFGMNVRSLVCPRCKGTNLHQTDVTVFDRFEDAAQVLQTRVGGGTIKSTVTNGDMNPSSRRHGLTISFSCEECGDGLELTVAQHKGDTHVGWRWDDAPVERKAHLAAMT